MPMIGGVLVPDSVAASLAHAPAKENSVGDVFRASMQNAWGQARYGIPYQIAKLQDEPISREDEAYYQANLAKASYLGSQAPAASLDDVTSGRKGVGRFLTENIVSMFPYMVGAAAGGAVGSLAGPAGTIAGAAAAGIPQFSASNVARAVEENGSLSEEAAVRSLAVAPLQSVADAAIGRFLPGAGKFFGRAAATQSGERFLTRTLKSMAEAGGTEAVTEAAQQVGERYAAGLELGDADATAEYVNAAVTAFAVGGVLGAGGGFRRTAAHAKPAEAVNNDDITSLVDGVLDGSLSRAAPRNLAPRPDGMAGELTGPTQPEMQFGMDLQGGQAEEQQLQLPDIGQPVQEALPSQLPQLPMDPALSTVPPETQLNLGDRFRDNLTPTDLPVEGSQVTPALEAALQAVTPAAQAPLTATTTLNRGLQPGAFESASVAADPVAVPATRVFADQPAADLNKVLKAKNADPEIRARVEEELTARTAEVTGDAALTTEKYQTRLDEVKEGLRGSFVQKLTAENPASMLDQVYTELFETANTASSVQKLGQRVGLLDENLAPTERANTIEQARAGAVLEAAAPEVAATPVVTSPTPNVDPSISAAIAAADAGTTAAQPNARPGPTDIQPISTDTNELVAEVTAARKAGNSRGRPDLKTPADVMAALAVDRVAPSNQRNTMVEKLAANMGLVTNDDAHDITPKGRQVFLASDAGAEAVGDAAEAAGFDKRGQRVFDRGVRNVIHNQQHNVAPDDAAAFDAGKAWAREFVLRGDVKTAAQTEAYISAEDAKRLARDPTAVDPVTGESKNTRRVLNGGQLAQQTMNNLLNAQDFTTTSDSDQAGLRRMVRDGATLEQLVEAIEAVKSGAGLFKESPRAEPILPPNPAGAGQPRFKEMYDPRKETPAKAIQRAESEAAVKAYEERRRIETTKQAAQINVEKADAAVKAKKTSATIKAAKAAKAQKAAIDTRAEKAGALLDRGEAAQAKKIMQAVEKEFGGIGVEPVSHVAYANGEIQYGDMTKAGRDWAQAIRAEENYQALLEDEPNLTREEYARRKTGGMKLVRAFLGGKFNPTNVVGNLAGTTDPAFERAITGMSFLETAAYMINNAPSVYHKELMLKIRTLTQMLQSRGMAFDIKIVGPQDTVPSEMSKHGVKALTYTTFYPEAKATVYLNDTEMGPDGALNYQTTQHEMVHAVTVLLTSLGRNKEHYRKTKLGKAVAALDDLLATVQDHINAQDRLGRANDFERQILDGRNNVLEDIDEMLAWGLTNPQMQRYLNKIEYKPRQSVFSRLTEAIRGILGMEPRHDSVLAELLRVSERLIPGTMTEVDALLPRNNPSTGEMVQRSAALRSGEGASAANRTVAAANEATKTAMGLIAAAADKANIADKGVKFRRVRLAWHSLNHLVREYGDRVPGLSRYADAKREQEAVRGRFAQMGVDQHREFEALERASPNVAAAVGELMGAVSEFRMDPSKTWAEHGHLGVFSVDEDGKVVPTPGKEADYTRLQGVFKQVQKLTNDVKRGNGAGWRVFENFRVLNEAQNFARMAANLHRRVATDREFSLGVANSLVNPTDVFMQSGGITDPKAVRDYWADALETQMSEATNFIREKKGELDADGTDADKQALRLHLSPIEMQIAQFKEAQTSMAKSPYFHLGRFGDNFGTAVIRMDKNGVVDPAALAHVAAELEKAGFADAQLSADNTRPRIAMRFEKVDQAQAFHRLMDQLKSEGWLDADTPIKSGPRAIGDGFYGTADGVPEYIQSYIQALQSDPIYQTDESMTAGEKAAINKQRDAAAQLAMDVWLDQQPDSSISKVLTKRNTTSGYDKNMARNWAHRWHVGSINIANVSAAPKLNAALVDIRSQANEALEGGDAYLPSDLLREVQLRDARTPVTDTADTFDKLRAVAHAFYLGFSPAYGMINMTQLGVVALPELAKKHGYTKSFHAMRRASNVALAVMKAATAESIALGPKHYADLTLTESSLQKAGIDAKTSAFLTRMIAAGTIDIGSAARAYGQITEDGKDTKLQIGLRYASAIGLYTETFSRLVTALAAADLHGGSDVDATAKYATKVVSNSMFDYQNWNTARQLGKQGFAGPVTPLLTQFMSYSVQITEKLYSEAMDAFSRPREGESAAATKQRKLEARRFLMGHLTAVTALAGTLGMPFATVFAAVIERIVDTFDDDEDPYDATAAWRGFLADVFGPEVAEVVARGLPRAFGADVSARAGEADLLPFSQLISDRRSWKESMDGYLGRSMGAAPNMLLSVAEGGSKFSDGDLLGGMKEFLPIALKGPTEFYRMTDQGYVDTRGTKLPMSPTASAYVWQLLGFTPAAKAEYSEARGDQQSRRGILSRQSGVLRQGILKAITSGDRDTAQTLIAEAQKFDQDNPTFAVLDGLQASLKRQTTQARQAAQIRAPLGVSVKDTSGQQLTDYANIDYGR